MSGEGLRQETDWTSARSEARGLQQHFSLCFQPTSNVKPSRCVQGHRVLSWTSWAPTQAIFSIINFQGDLWHSIAPALCVTSSYLCWPGAALEPGSRFQSNEHFLHFQFVSCLPPPLGDATLPDTLPSLPRDLHQCRTFPLVRAFSHRDEGSHSHPTLLSHDADVRPQPSSPARWRLLLPRVP